MDLTKHIEHVRLSHFYLLVLCAVVAVTGYVATNSNKNAHLAYKELAMLERMLEDWNSNWLESKAIENITTFLPFKYTEEFTGNLSLSNEEHYSSGHHNVSEITSILQPYFADTSTLITPGLLEQWEATRSENSFYNGPYREEPTELNYSDVFFHQPPLNYNLPKPLTISQLQEFWDILSLPHQLVLAKPIITEIRGHYSISKYIYRQIGGASLRQRTREELEFHGGYYYSGTIEPRSLPQDLRNATIYGFIDDWSPDLGEEQEKYQDFVRKFEAMDDDYVLRLSLNYQFQVMAGNGIGWVEELEQHSPSKNLSVDTVLEFPIKTVKFDIDPQGLLLEELPVGYPKAKSIQLGKFQDSFPSLAPMVDAFGNTPIQEAKHNIKERIDSEQKESFISVLGVPMPVALILVFGSIAVLFAQTYYLLHVKNLFDLAIRESTYSLEYQAPWVGAYQHSYLSNFTLLLTTAILPPATVVYVLWTVGITWYTASSLVIVVLMSLAQVKTYRNYWKSSQNAA